MNYLRFVRRRGLRVSGRLLVALSSVVLGPVTSSQAAVVAGGRGPQLLIGQDDDNITNVRVQADATAEPVTTAPTFSTAGPAMTCCLD